MIWVFDLRVGHPILRLYTDSCTLFGGIFAEILQIVEKFVYLQTERAKMV